MLPTRTPLEGLVELSADARAVVQKNLKDAYLALTTVNELINRGNPDKESIYSALYVAEAALARVSKETDVPIDSVTDREERYARLRSANQRIHELERQIGAAVTPDALKSGIKEFSRRLDAWWDQYGFGYISEMQIRRYGGYTLKLSCNPRGRLHSFDSSTPVSDKNQYEAWLQTLEAAGCSILRHEGRGDEQLEDTPAARKYLKDLVAAHLPSAKITDLETSVDRHDNYHLRYISLYIDNLQEIADLKVGEDQS